MALHYIVDTKTKVITRKNGTKYFINMDTKIFIVKKYLKSTTMQNDYTS